MMHFPPCLGFPPYFLKIFTLRKIFTILPFPEKFLDFHLEFSPLFSLFQYISPSVSRKLLFPPCFDKFPLCFRQFHLLFTYFTYISFPPTLTMMHLCITQCAYWTPLLSALAYRCAVLNARAHACMHVCANMHVYMYCIHNLDICIKTLVYALLYLINATNVHVDIKVLLKVDRA